VKPFLSASSPATPTSNSPSANNDLAGKVAEAKRRVADAQSKLAVEDNPYMVLSHFFLLYQIIRVV
jgi:hypothetical protein